MDIFNYVFLALALTEGSTRGTPRPPARSAVPKPEGRVRRNAVRFQFLLPHPNLAAISLQLVRMPRMTVRGPRDLGEEGNDSEAAWKPGDPDTQMGIGQSERQLS